MPLSLIDTQTRTGPGLAKRRVGALAVVEDLNPGPPVLAVEELELHLASEHSISAFWIRLPSEPIEGSSPA